MKRKIYFVVMFVVLGSQLTFAQDITPVKDSSYWNTKLLFGINGTQSSFVNWAAGGRNNISVLGFVDGTANYRKERWKWDNDLKLALGGIRFFDKTPGSKYQKTDDRIDIQSTLGYEIVNDSKWYFTLTSGFKTQMMNGYSYPNDSIKTSKFMAPGYFSTALGIEYAPNKDMNIFLSPIALKYTFVRDRMLSDQGAFGVDKAEYSLGGELIKHGKMFRQEYGAYFRFIYNKEIVKNVEMKSRLELFSNYLNNPQNIDVNAEVIFTFKVNSWLSASVQWNLIYDDDIKITDNKGRTGPRTQFKSVLGLGVSYALKNQNAKKEKK